MQCREHLSKRTLALQISLGVNELLLLLATAGKTVPCWAGRPNTDVRGVDGSLGGGLWCILPSTYVIDAQKGKNDGAEAGEGTRQYG